MEEVLLTGQPISEFAENAKWAPDLCDIWPFPWHCKFEVVSTVISAHQGQLMKAANKYGYKKYFLWENDTGVTAWWDFDVS